MQRDSGVPRHVHTIAAAGFLGDDAVAAPAVSPDCRITPRPTRRARRSRHPRARVAHRAPATGRRHPHRPRFSAATPRPRALAAATVAFSRSPLLSLDSCTLPPPPIHSPVHHQPSFLFGPRPRSRTPMVRGRGRGPNRPPTPCPIENCTGLGIHSGSILRSVGLAPARFSTTATTGPRDRPHMGCQTPSRWRDSVGRRSARLIPYSPRR